LLSYPEAVGVSVKPLIEHEGIQFHFLVNVQGDVCSPGSSFEIWTGNYGKTDFLDGSGKPKDFLPPQHPDTNGSYFFTEYSWNYYGEKPPVVGDICPIEIYVRSTATEAKLFSINADQIVGFDSTRAVYLLPDLVLTCN
jgi:hypothetical protein